MAELTILGAAYGPVDGPVDVTPKIWSLVKDQKLQVTANNATFSDTWPGVGKSLVIVYSYSGHADQVAIASEGNTIDLSPPSDSFCSTEVTQHFRVEKMKKIAEIFHDGRMSAMINWKFLERHTGSRM